MPYPVFVLLSPTFAPFVVSRRRPQQENMRWILKQRRLEDEAKEDEGRPKQNKILASRYVSRRGCVDTIFFPDAYYLPAVLRQEPFSADKAKDGSGAAGGPDQSGSKYDRRCKITGAPAPYKDPLTGHYYANAAAFRQVRKRYGASARQRLKAQRQEREASEAASRGAAAAGAGGGVAPGSRVDGDASETAGSVAAGAVAGAVGNGSLRGGGAGAAAGGGGQSVGGAGKKHGSSSSKEGEKKSKSSAGKSEGKTKGRGGAAAGKGAAAAAVAVAATAGAGAAVVARVGESGTTAVAATPTSAAGPERIKTGTKRKQIAGGKGAKPAKRPFFAPSPGATGAAPSVLAPPVAGGGHGQPQLVPLKGHNTATIHYGASPPGSPPEGSAVVKAAAYAAVAAQHAAATGNGGGHDTTSEGSSVVKAAAYAAVAAQRTAAVTAPGGGGASPATSQSAAAAPAQQLQTLAGRVVPLVPTAAGSVPGAMAQPQPMLSSHQRHQHQHQQQGTAAPGVPGQGLHGWDSGSNTAVGAPTQAGWQHPVPAAAPLRPPQG